MLGHYRLDARIDAGGMGVVYRAHNTHLDTAVALKVLPPAMVGDEAARRRLRKEAHVVARVVHPNISAVHDLDCQDGIDFLVLEYVPGVTLRDRLENGPLPEREIVAFGAQLASALEAAHQHGVIHCDLKPANIRITPDRHLKVLDFGLAYLRRAVAPHSRAGPAPESSTEPASATRGAGGTPQYMAPELFDSGTADERTDIYGAGTVLYAMATGRAPFNEATTARLLHAILREMPAPPREINAHISGELQRIILKCLDKDPDRRYQTARELHVDLRRILEPVTLPANPRGLGHGARTDAGRALRIAVAVAVAGVIAAGLWAMRGDGPAAVAATMTSLVTWPGEETGGRLSPDGKWASFCAAYGGQQGVWAVPVTGGDPQLLATGSGTIGSHAWSPDGSEIAYVRRDDSGSYLQFASAFGGAARASVLLDASLRSPDLLRWTGGAIDMEVPRRGLVRFDIATRHATTVLPAHDAAGATAIYFDIAGDLVAWTRVERATIGIALSRVDGRDMRMLTDSTSTAYQPRWLGPGGRRLVYSSSRGGQIDLWQMDVGSGVATQITFSPADERVEAASRDGSLILMSQTEDDAHLWIIDAALPGARRQLTADLLQDAWPSVARGGSRVVFQRNKPRQQGVLDVAEAQLLMASLADAGLTAVAPVVSSGGCPLLSPQGNWLAYTRTGAGGRYELWLADLQTRHAWRVADRFRIPNLYRFPIDWVQRMVAWSPDERHLYFVVLAGDGDTEIRRVEVQRDSTDSQVVAPARRGLYGDLDVSPGGDAFAYTWSAPDNGARELHHLDLVSGDDRVLLTQVPSGLRPVLCSRGWLDDRRSLVVLRGRTRADLTDDVDIDAVTPGRPPRRLASATRVFSGTARLDAARATLYVTVAGAGDVHNVQAVDLRGGRTRLLTDNSVAGVSYAGLEVVDGGELMFVQQKRNEDLMVIRFDPRPQP
jgi:Tol biopolymer transport system component